jgi:hypothetical protein
MARPNALQWKALTFAPEEPFYEWRTSDKQPFAIAMSDDDLMVKARAIPVVRGWGWGAASGAWRARRPAHKADKAGIKAERPNLRVVGKRSFKPLTTMEEVVEELFGPIQQVAPLVSST